jgi:hypothetical protein
LTSQFISFCAAVLLTSAASLTAAEAPRDECPLRLNDAVPQAVAASPKDGRAAVRFTNTGQADIRAFVVTVSREGDAKPFLVHREILSTATDSANLLKPGDTREVRLSLGHTPIAPPVKGLSVDLVVFRDGSTCGPDSEDNRQFIRGVLAGAEIERKRSESK